MHRKGGVYRLHISIRCIRARMPQTLTVWHVQNELQAPQKKRKGEKIERHRIWKKRAECRNEWSMHAVMASAKKK